MKQDQEFDLKPKPEFKCEHCGKAESKHRAFDKGCPLGTNGPFSKTQFFKASDKMTPMSKKMIARYEHEQKMKAERIEAFLVEKQKVRALTFEEVVTAAVELLSDRTMLGVRVETEHEWNKKLFLHTLKGRIDLGYISVSVHQDGRYSVAGTRAGCFMGNHSNRDISNVLEEEFRKLEERANAEKV